MHSAPCTNTSSSALVSPATAAISSRLSSRARMIRLAPRLRASSTAPASVQVICVEACSGSSGATARASPATPRSCTIRASTPAAAQVRMARSATASSLSNSSVLSAT
jgi:hypothetical protein